MFLVEKGENANKQHDDELTCLSLITYQAKQPSYLEVMTYHILAYVLHVGLSFILTAHFLKSFDSNSVSFHTVF